MRGLPATFSEIADAVTHLLSTRGPMTPEQMLESLRADGLDLGRDPEETLDDVLYSDDLPLVFPLADDRMAYLPAVLEGQVFTHRLTAEEVDYGFLDVMPDLSPLGPMCDDDFLQLPDGTPIRDVFGDMRDRFPVDRELPDDYAAEAFLLPPKFLAERGFTAGQLVGMRYRDGGVDVVAVNDAVGDGNAVAKGLAAFFAGGDEARPMQVDSLVYTVLADDPAAMREPFRPLAEVLTVAGLAIDSDQVAPADFDFDSWHLATRLDGVMQRHELDEGEALVVMGLTSVFETMQLMLENADSIDADALFADDDSDETFDADIVRPMLAYLEEPAIAAALLTETIGATTERAAALGFFAESMEASAPRAARPALRWLRGKAHERLGDIIEAEKLYGQAETLDPSWPLTLFDLARYASDRGDAERALALLRRADAPPDDDFVQLLEQFRPPDRNLARNAPCWCGSGRKYKQCHQNREQLPLEERARWLYEKALTFLSDGPWRVSVISLVSVMRAEEMTADELWESLRYGRACDALLFEGGAFEEFLEQRGFLLPDDERLLAEQWLLVERSLFEIEEVAPGEGLVLRDVRTGDRHDVRERTATHELRPGMLMCGRVAPAGDTMQLFGGGEIVEFHHRDALLELLDSHPDPWELVSFFAGLHAPPELRTMDGEPLVMCTASLKAADVAAVAAALDTLYERETGGAHSWIDQEVLHGMPRVRATLRLDGDTLSVQTNNEKRMDDALAELAALDPAPVLDDDVRLPAAEVMEAMQRSGSPDGSGSMLDTTDPAVAEALDQVVRKYEESWLDESIPALGGVTPREAADDPTRRPDLIRLLNSFPAADGEPGLMDPDRLRAALELD
jgi:tetratricopeptide (TPR) repeat protein